MFFACGVWSCRCLKRGLKCVKQTRGRGRPPRCQQILEATEASSTSSSAASETTSDDDGEEEEELSSGDEMVVEEEEEAGDEKEVKAEEDTAMDVVVPRAAPSGGDELSLAFDACCRSLSELSASQAVDVFHADFFR